MPFGWLDAVVGLLPGCLWLWYFRRKDVWEPEPLAALVRVFLWGALAGWGIAWVRPRLEGFLPAEPGLWLDLADAFLVTALAEETVKLLAIVAGALWASEWDEPMDGIVYGAAAALGFASFENAVYVATSEQAWLVLARAFTANLAHVAFSASVGFFAGLGKLRGRTLPWMLFGLAAACVPHGLYDLWLFSRPEWNALSLLGVLPASLVLLGLKIRWSSARSPFRPLPVSSGAGGSHGRTRRAA